MTITLTPAPGVEITVETSVAVRLLEQLNAALADADTSSCAVLPEHHPSWDRRSGGAGHDEPEWTSADEKLAEAFYDSVGGKAKVFFDLLLERPGRQLSVDDLIEASSGVFTSSFSIAGAINGLRLPRTVAERRYPFAWWEGTPTRYAVKPSVAQLFTAARAKSS